jgi:hypothetical protein
MAERKLYNWASGSGSGSGSLLAVGLPMRAMGMLIGARMFAVFLCLTGLNRRRLSCGLLRRVWWQQGNLLMLLDADRHCLVPLRRYRCHLNASCVCTSAKRLQTDTEMD